jgi:hypothetical protein
MPTILRVNGYRFFFWSKEDGEPVHIHIEKAEASAKVWLKPLADDYFYGFSPREIKEIREIINENIELFITKWNEYHGR